MAKQRNAFAGFQFQVDALNRFQFAVLLAYIFD